MTYKRQSNCTVTCEVQTRPDVKNPERSERTSRPENERSIGWRELNRIEKATPIRGSRPADSPGFARTNAGRPRGSQIFGGMILMASNFKIARHTSVSGWKDKGTESN